MKNRRQWQFSRATCDKIRTYRIEQWVENVVHRLKWERENRRKQLNNIKQRKDKKMAKEYKIWIEIEEYDTETEESTETIIDDMVCIRVFDNKESAQAFLHDLELKYDF